MIFYLIYTKEMEEQIKWGALDCIDERNYSYSEIAWNDVEIKDFVLLDDWVIQDQNKAWYTMWCVYFASSMNDNYCNKRDWIQDRSLWWELCEMSSTRSATLWDFLINWPKLLKKLDLIEWYFQINSIDEAKIALSNSQPIHCWTNKIDWWLTRQDNIAVIWSWVWHAFHIIWFNATWNEKIDALHKIPNNCFICKNSGTWYDNWFFYLKFEDFENLFYTKIIFENKLDNILLYKKKIMANLKLDSAKKCFELGIWSWENPNSAVTREECAAMVYRMYEKLKNNE